MLSNQMQALQNIYEYLLDAERQMGAGTEQDDAENYSMETGQSVPVAAGAGDTNICGGIIQLYWDKILARCLDFHEPVRQAALKVRFSWLILTLIRPCEFCRLVSQENKDCAYPLCCCRILLECIASLEVVQFFQCLKLLSYCLSWLLWEKFGSLTRKRSALSFSFHFILMCELWK